MYGTMDDWRAARAALVEELTRLRDQLNCGTVGRCQDLRPAAGLAPAPGFHAPGGRPTMSGLCN